MNTVAGTGQPNRLCGRGLIDRRRQFTFEFDGRRLGGYAGDTLASALLAAGVKLIARSFKYHRPRGLLTAGSEEPNGLVELRRGARREANTRATVVELFDGLQARSQNRWPSLTFDCGAINDLLSPLFVGGFYYKTFMWPSAFWERLYEPAIRHAAGLGRASGKPDPDTYEKRHAFCDLLVIGGGAAGLSAALSAGHSGARVILCDEDFVIGGRLNAEQREIEGMSGSAWAARAETELQSMPEVCVLRRTTVFGVYDGNTFGAVERLSDHLLVPPAHHPRQRLWKIVAKRTVLASGAVERSIVFGGNDRPGVMMASAVRTYLNRFGVTPGRRVALFTSSDDGWKTAFDLSGAGVPIEAIVDARKEVPPHLLIKSKHMDTRVFAGAQVVGTKGNHALRAVGIRDKGGRLITLLADTLAVSGGWNPNIALATHLGARPRWSDAISAFVPSEELGGVNVVGAACGCLSLNDALRQGAAAGAAAAESLGFTAPRPRPARADDEPVDVKPVWYVPESAGKAFVDLQHDVTQDDIALAGREGFRSAEHLKRYTTMGMATDQGRTSNTNGIAILASLTGRTISDVGTTVFRPPYTPVAIGAFAGLHRGRSFKPVRITAGHRWAEEQGASFVETGQWLRAQWFSTAGESDWMETVAREVRAVRSQVGICDVSTLGKIDIQGPDALALLERLYINNFSTLAVGKARYGLMLREDGIVFDDGTSARISTNHYLMSTTTANASAVMQHLEHARQVLCPGLDVQIASVSEQWSQYSIAGPKSRDLLRALLCDAIDLSNGAFPYLACAEFMWDGIIARLFRISFSGELSYELAVPARYGEAVARAIMTAGKGFGVVPYGLEALNIMRIEKGHIAGNEIDGTTTAADLGFKRMMSNKKDFIGRVLAGRLGLSDPVRPTLVGVRPIDEKARLYAGAHFFAPYAASTLANDQGHITSAAFSPILGTWIGLGLLAYGPQRHGERIRACSPLHSHEVEVEVVSSAHFDPDGTRLKG